jgi:hypothetical protein
LPTYQEIAMWIKRLLMFALTSGLAAKALQVYVQKEKQQRARKERVLQRDAVQRWEDEGGNLQPR